MLICNATFTVETLNSKVIIESTIGNNSVMIHCPLSILQINNINFNPNNESSKIITVFGINYVLIAVSKFLLI